MCFRSILTTHFVFFVQSTEKYFSFQNFARTWTSHICVSPIFFRIFHNVLLFFFVENIRSWWCARVHKRCSPRKDIIITYLNGTMSKDLTTFILRSIDSSWRDMIPMMYEIGRWTLCFFALLFYLMHYCCCIQNV